MGDSLVGLAWKAGERKRLGWMASRPALGVVDAVKGQVMTQRKCLMMPAKRETEDQRKTKKFVLLRGTNSVIRRLAEADPVAVPCAAGSLYED